MLVYADHVSVTVGDTILLSPTSLQAQSGEVVALRGGNGSGKTTLLRVLAGILPPSSGRVAIAGEPVDLEDTAFRRRVASLIGLPPLARNLTLAEHIRLVGLSWGQSADSVEIITEELMFSLGISTLISRFPHELSSGQTQLFALALTLARPSEVLILDEPEQRLDSGRMVRVRDSIRNFVGQGRAVVMATHNQWLADELSSQSVTLFEANAANG